jgi:hypothetical protein
MEVSVEVNIGAKKERKIIRGGRDLDNEIYNLYCLLHNVGMEISKRKRRMGKEGRLDSNSTLH